MLASPAFSEVDALDLEEEPAVNICSKLKGSLQVRDCAQIITGKAREGKNVFV